MVDLVFAQSGAVRVTVVEAGERLGGRVGQGFLKGVNQPIDIGVCCGLPVSYLITTTLSVMAAQGEIVHGEHCSTYAIAQSQGAETNMMFDVDITSHNKHDTNVYVHSNGAATHLYPCKSPQVQRMSCACVLSLCYCVTLYCMHCSGHVADRRA